MKDVEEDTKKVTKHFLHFPYASILFGQRLGDVVGTVRFTVIESEESKRVDIEEVTGVENNHREIDLSYLVAEEFPVEFRNHFFNCIMENKSQWDVNDVWWQ